MDRLARAARTGALATAAAALAGCGLLRPAPPEPHSAGAMAAGLAGCQAGQVDRTTWRVQCGGLVAQVHDPYGEGDSDLLALGEERLTLVGCMEHQPGPHPEKNDEQDHRWHRHRKFYQHYKRA